MFLFFRFEVSLTINLSGDLAGQGGGRGEGRGEARGGGPKGQNEENGLNHPFGG